MGFVYEGLPPICHSVKAQREGVYMEARKHIFNDQRGVWRGNPAWNGLNRGFTHRLVSLFMYYSSSPHLIRLTGFLVCHGLPFFSITYLTFYWISFFFQREFWIYRFTVVGLLYTFTTYTKVNVVIVTTKRDCEHLDQSGKGSRPSEKNVISFIESNVFL